MPSVVLRHPDLPGQPVVVEVPVGGYVSASYRDAGWTIDTQTDPLDAVKEAPEPREQPPFTPQFEPAPDTDLTQRSTSAQKATQELAATVRKLQERPAEPVNPEPADPAPLDLSKE